MKEKKKFYTRSFVSYFLFFTFIIIAVTGLLLYITPPGRIARWTGWSILGMTKDQLEGIHTIASFAFILSAIFHVFVYNRRPLWYYIKKQSAQLKFKRKYVIEFMVALILSIIIFVGSYVPFPPFSTLIDMGDDLKKSWGDKSVEAPVPEAHKLTLEEFSQQVLGKDVRDVITMLETHGLKVNGKHQRIVNLAKSNNCSPAELYQILKNMEETSSVPHEIQRGKRKGINQEQRRGQGKGQGQGQRQGRNQKNKW